MKKSYRFNMFFYRSYFIYFYAVALAFFILSTNVTNVYSQDSSFGFSTRHKVKGETVLDGYIVSNSVDGYEVTTEAYQPNMAGVVTERPAIEIANSETETEATYPISSNGESLVWVSLANGEIKQGDYITSSPFEGIGMKATRNGWVVGVALSGTNIGENAQNKDTIVTKIKVAINPMSGFIENNNSNERVSNASRPSTTEIVVASIIVLTTILFSLNFFMRLSTSGVEAIGRNPLAFKKIEFGITINVVVGLLIALFGIAIAFYILN